MPEHPKPPFHEPPQSAPGSETEMRTRPDHGEASYRGYGRLQGKSALITGGDSGIGRAIAIAFAREGADVAISFLPEEEKDAQETMGWVRDAGCCGLELPGDIRAEEQCGHSVDGTITEFGAIVTFTKALSGLAVKYDVRVNAVAPGPVWTPSSPPPCRPKRWRNLAQKAHSNAQPSPPSSHPHTSTWFPSIRVM